MAAENNGPSYGEYEEYFYGPSEEDMMEKKLPYESVKCPKCNGPMISRKSKHGVFWGCKAYPECNGIRDNMGDARRSDDTKKKPKFSFSKK